MQPHPPFDSDVRPSRLQRVSYNLDSDRLPPSASSSACSTPRSFNSYNGSLIGASNVRHLPADVQSPQNVVAQIRDAHKQMLALSRNNFAKTAPDSELRPQSPAVTRSGWQHDTDLQNEQRSLDSISEVSDSRYQQEQLLSQGYQQPDTSFREKELQQQNERLSRELVALNHDRDKQLHEQFKRVQEQQLQFEDLKQHASVLETQLQESENSSGELLKVNQFLDAELKKHKAWLDQSQATSSHYRHLFKQEEHEKQQLTQQLHDTQSQLADTWRESSRKQELLAELEGQTAAAADHQARAKELSEANRKLDITNGKLLDSQQALEDSNRELGFQLDGLRSALTDALQEHEAAQESNAEQRAQQAAHHSHVEARLADGSQQLEQAHAELQALHALPAQHAQHEAESASKLAQLTRANEQLQQQISSLDTQLGQAEHALHEARQSAQRAQQAAQDSDRLAELQGRNSQLERHIASLGEECSAKGSQVRQLLKLQEQFEVSEAARQAQHVGNAGVIADLTATNHQLQTQLTSTTEQLQEAQAKRNYAEDSKAAQQAQRAAADSTHTEAVANLTLVNGQLMNQISELNTQLEQVQTELHAATSAQQADAASRLSQDDSMQLHEQVQSMTQQLEQSQHELQMHSDSSAKHAQQHPSTSTQTEADEVLVEQTSNLSRQLEQTKHDLHLVQDSNAAQHAQQAADSSEDITDLTAANSRLMEQAAESQDKIAAAQQEAAAATKKLQHMRDLVKAQHAKREEHAASLQTQLDSLQQECHRKDEQVQELQSKLQQAEASQPSQQDFDKLVKANRQFEDQTASIDLQLEQTQQELEESQQGLAQTQQQLTQTQEELAQAQEEVAASQEALQEQTELVASQRAQHAQQQAQQAASKPLEEECVAKALQVQQLLTQVDQLTDDHEALNKQVQYLNQQNGYVSDKSDQKDAQIVQLTAQLEALQQEHHRLTGSHMDQEKQNSLLQEECAQLQTYISALDEDLGKAQAHMDGILSADGNSTSKQNEMLKAAAKQVIQIKAQDAPRSRMPRLLRKFSTRKKDKSAAAIGEGAVSRSHPQIHPVSPRAAPLTSRPQPQSPRPNPVSRSVSGITTASQETTGVAVKETSENGSSGGVTGPLTPSEQAPSVAATEAPPELHRLKEENSDLAQKLAQANKDMAELNSRLVNAAFGNAFSGALPESFMPSADRVEGSSQLDRQSSNPASEEQNSILGLPPGVPLDTLYDD